MAQINDFPIETTPLATVSTSSTADAVLVVSSGTVKKVSLDSSASAPLAGLTYTVVATW